MDLLRQLSEQAWFDERLEEAHNYLAGLGYIIVEVELDNKGHVVYTPPPPEEKIDKSKIKMLGADRSKARQERVLPKKGDIIHFPMAGHKTVVVQVESVPSHEIVVVNFRKGEHPRRKIPANQLKYQGPVGNRKDMNLFTFTGSLE